MANILREASEEQKEGEPEPMEEEPQIPENIKMEIDLPRPQIAEQAGYLNHEALMNGGPREPEAILKAGHDFAQMLDAVAGPADFSMNLGAVRGDQEEL